MPINESPVGSMSSRKFSLHLQAGAHTCYVVFSLPESNSCSRIGEQPKARALASLLFCRYHDSWLLVETHELVKLPLKNMPLRQKRWSKLPPSWSQPWLFADAMFSLEVCKFTLNSWIEKYITVIVIHHFVRPVEK